MKATMESVPARTTAPDGVPRLYVSAYNAEAGTITFAPTDVAVAINPATVTATSPGVGTVTCECHDQLPQDREVTIVSATAALISASIQPEQGETGFEWHVSGVETDGAVAFEDIDVRVS